MVNKRVFILSAFLGSLIISCTTHQGSTKTSNLHNSTVESLNVFLVDKKEAKTYVNPLCLPRIPVVKASNKGKIPDDPFALSRMIIQGLPETHKRFETLFGGLIPYVCENDTRSTADPSGFYYKGMWYIYGSQGALWSSKDFVGWDFTDLSYAYTMAPTIAVRTGDDGKDKYYLAGNSTDLFAADNPKGTFTSLGVFTHNGKSISPQNNDVNIYVDDDKRMYLYWGMGPGIYGAELDVNNPTKLLTEPKTLIEFNPNNEYERFGQHNQNWENGFPEGAWMVKYHGTYYLTWATAGTQYDTYCIGAYKSKTGPLDGFSIQKKPVTNNVNRFVRGGGHGSIVVGPDDTLWCFYTVNIGYEGDMERRLGCDPATIDENGDLYVPAFHETPEYVPGVMSIPGAKNDADKVNITARQSYYPSSYSEGRQSVYALDDSTLTWWQPSVTDKQPSLLVSLQGNYYVTSARVLFKEIGLDIASGDKTGPFKYKVEVMDRKDNTWKTLIDRTNNTDDYIMDYRTADNPVYGQFVKLTITGWPEGITPAVVEFTCFGESAEKPGAGK
jgi:xylan 1,4-beta-xylosidase